MEENRINVWENDPGTGQEFNGGVIIEVDAPDISATTFSIRTGQPEPPPAEYAQGTFAFRYWNLAAALANASSFWNPILPGIPWQTGTILNVVMDGGEALHSEYSRLMKAVRFFHKKIQDKTIFTCESPDLVYHETGHAILDAFKPELWQTSIAEVKAFHEAFGDISAILCSLQSPDMRTALLAETQGRIYSSSRVSRFAKQFGWAKRQRDPSTAEVDCFRNAVNSFFYKDAGLLPATGTVHELTGEPHSLSRVFTGALFEGFAGMCMVHPQTDENAIELVSRHIAFILIHGVSTAKVVDLFFTEVATMMVHVANARFPDIAYGQALRSVFIRHGILSPAGTAAFATPLFSKDTDFDSLLKNHPGKPENIVLPVAQYGLGIDKIVMQGAEKTIDSNAKKAKASATAHFESLLATGRLKMEDATMGSMGMKVLRPCKQTDDLQYTHELKKEGSEYVLERLCI